MQAWPEQNENENNNKNARKHGHLHASSEIHNDPVSSVERRADGYTQILDPIRFSNDPIETFSKSPLPAGDRRGTPIVLRPSSAVSVFGLVDSRFAIIVVSEAETAAFQPRWRRPSTHPGCIKT